MSNINWVKIKNDYITGTMSYRELAEMHGVSHKQISNVAKAEKWVEMRKSQRDRISAKLQQENVDMTVEYLREIQELAKRLLDKLRQAIEELTYELSKDGKENVDMVNVDRLRKITQALKDLKDIQTMPESDSDNSFEKLIEGLLNG